MELEKLFEEQLSDSRQGLNKQFTLTDLPRQSVHSRTNNFVHSEGPRVYKRAHPGG
ncbi:MAG: hypothetical protein ACRD4Q_13235 [Candidatus Acidiferrales bacterium]